MVKIDNTTREIIGILRQDARMTYKEVAEKLGKPESTIRDRILRLENAGIIRGYTTILDKKALGLGCYALVLADVEYEKLGSVTKRLVEMPNVLQVHHTSGDNRLAFVLATKDLDDLQATLEREIAPLGFKAEEVVVLLKTFREFGAVLEF